MALQVWLPLNGDLHNQGLTDVTTTSSGSTGSWNAAGKIGKCLYSSGSTFWTISSLNLGMAVSICCWVRTTDNNAMFWVLNADQGGGHSSRFLNLWSYNGFLYLNTGDSAQNPFQDDDGNDVPNKIDNLWHHYATVFTDNKCLLYIDGVYCGKAKTYRNPITTNNFIRIFGGFQNGHAYDLAGYMNDFRIYDHCLSAKEVHEISKGLVLHYKMDGWFDANNIFKDSIFTWHALTVNTSYTRSDSTYTVTIGNYRDPYTFATSRMAIPVGVLEDGAQYTISFKYKVISGNGLINLDGCDWCDVRFISKHEDIFGDYHYVKLVCPITTYNTKRFMDFSWTSTNTVYEISDICLYKLSNICYDVSGYGNNGEINGTVVSATDTPRYQSCTSFDDGTSYIKRESLYGNIKTISVWFKTTKDTSTRQLIFADSNSRMGAIIVPSGLVTYCYGGPGGTGSRVLFGNEYIENGWNHIVVISTGLTTRDVYCNGVKLEATENNFYNVTDGNLYIGRRSITNLSAIPFYGSISDLRVYSTALGAEDIKELYDTGQVIDKGGNFYCYELNEESTQPELLKTGIVKANELIEIKLLDYITSTGSQYINTGIVLNSPYNIEHYADVQFANTSTNFETIYGFMSLTGTLNKPRYGIHKYSQKWMIGVNGTTLGSTVDTNRHKMLFITASTNHQSLSIDNTVLINNFTMDNTGYSTNNMPLYLFARNNGNTTIVNYFSGNIGRTWLKQNGEYLYDYYPCIGPNDEVGMYDKVSGNFLKSDSGTNFIAGPMVSGSEINMCMCKDYILTNQLIEI